MNFESKSSFSDIQKKAQRVPVDAAGLYLMLSNQLQAHGQMINHNLADIQDRMDRRLNDQMRSLVKDLTSSLSPRGASSGHGPQDRRARQRQTRQEAPIHVHKEHPKKNLLKVSSLDKPQK